MKWDKWAEEAMRAAERESSQIGSSPVAREYYKLRERQVHEVAALMEETKIELNFNDPPPTFPDLVSTIELNTIGSIGTPGHTVVELGAAKLWQQFTFETPNAEISGTMRTQQDLRDALRELLALLETC